MPEQTFARRPWAVALALALAAIPASAFPPAAQAQSTPGLLSMATVCTLQPGLFAASSQAAATNGSPLSNTQRWYVSFLTQQRVITAQVDELKERLRQNRIGTEEFLEGLDPLLQRADRLYAKWKTIGARNAQRLSAAEARPTGVGGRSTLLAARTAAPTPGHPAEGAGRNDAAVGKCLNYLRLSIVNLFLGYADSNGSQIDDADRQADLSVVWRSKSLFFIRALETAPGQPES